MAVGTAVLRQVRVGGDQLAGAWVEHLQLDFPTFTRPLTLRATGITAHIQQVKLPKVGGWVGGPPGEGGAF